MIHYHTEWGEKKKSDDYHTKLGKKHLPCDFNDWGSQINEIYQNQGYDGLKTYVKNQNLRLCFLGRFD